MESRAAVVPTVQAPEEAAIRKLMAFTPPPPPKALRFTSHPVARALRRLGTQHLYADTADPAELHDLLRAREDEHTVTYYEEVDGNTTNQPLVEKVFDRLLETEGPGTIRSWIQTLQKENPKLGLQEATVIVYSILNARLGWEVVGRFALGRTWHVSLELHTALGADRVGSVRIGRCLGRAVPGALVKVAFTPDHPHAFLIARDLEEQGIAVNFTATFSARQVVAAALLSNPHRTNIFLGRLNEGLRAQVLGEHILLEAQRHMRRLRARYGLHTLNMGASVRRAETLMITAGCDAYTVPTAPLKAFLAQQDLVLEDRTDADLSEELGVDAQVVDAVGGMSRIRRLYEVEPEFVEFLVALRSSPEFARMDGDALGERFERAGFGDLFYRPSPEEWLELRKSKLPDLTSPLVRRIPLDTLMSLLAIGDFTNFQERMDAKIQGILEPW